jgi:hypothetical protein
MSYLHPLDLRFLNYQVSNAYRQARAKEAWYEAPCFGKFEIQKSPQNIDEITSFDPLGGVTVTALA